MRLCVKNIKKFHAKSQRRKAVLKLKNTNYNISLTDEENETIKLLKSKTLFTKEKIEKMIKQHNEKIKFFIEKRLSQIYSNFR